MDKVIYIRNSIIRSILGIILGLLMILWPNQIANYLIMLTGGLFAVCGIYAIILYVRSKERRQFVYPVISAASILLGGLLIFLSQPFINILMYIWGGILALAGIQQTVSIIVARRRGASTPYGLYILPSLIAITGVALLLKPIENPDYILIILGTATLLYGLNEMLLRYKFRSQFRSSVQEVKESEINEAQAL